MDKMSAARTVIAGRAEPRCNERDLCCCAHRRGKDKGLAKLAIRACGREAGRAVAAGKAQVVETASSLDIGCKLGIERLRARTVGKTEKQNGDGRKGRNHPPEPGSQYAHDR